MELSIKVVLTAKVAWRYLTAKILEKESRKHV
jgi:hypothetical protein